MIKRGKWLDGRKGEYREGALEKGDNGERERRGKNVKRKGRC